MLFQKRLERAREVQRHLQGLDAEQPEKENELEAELVQSDPVEAAEQACPEESEKKGGRRKRSKKKKNALELEKGDTLALVISAFLTLFLPAVLVLTALVLIGFLVFRLF